MAHNRHAFFDLVRTKLFKGRLATGQVEGLTAILDGWQARVGQDEAQPLAYVLATAFHETAATMQPVRETLASSDRSAIARLEEAFAAGRLGSVKTPYWRLDADGKSWLGRGLVQLTHRRNYEAMSAVTGIDLVADPGRAMEMPVSVAILIEGMRRGSFTGRKLGDYFGRGRTDWLGARKIINGNDRAELVARHAQVFTEALDTKPH
ncbi:chitinase [Neorhizobium galegae]|uniref:Putative chitinase n=1 Tax=Neorhizobium galegae bv. orientalis str. HAMBI 540 TaxID=1028800 RepID=A0A068SPR2_NEOGA|nr:chitinase [Neorhizobium galegae]CDN47055.1 Putative chitinase [Neorhizobium galegae bv. orientalis str. HAMBI 540]